ncbi:MAG: hypothetical protein J5725_06385 [Bacteroidales bacterium]|nr:hypothetical protein [Bacteroidales bacterium]
MTVKKLTNSDSVITSADLQIKYEHLYKFLMDFLWEFPVVQSLANLEIAIFKRFPDKDEMLKCIHELKRNISYTYNELAQADDTEFKDTMEDLESAIEDYEDPGCELYSVAEVIDSPDDVVDASEDIEVSDTGKRKFEFGEIRKLSKEEKDLQEEAMRSLENPFETEEGT